MLTGIRLKEKTRLFAPKMQALAHPHRLAILHILAYGELPLHAIVANLDEAENLVSHHIKKLLITGWVGKRIEGRQTYYFIKERGFFELFRMLVETPFYRNTLMKQLK
jgi:DNA-binding transcriptional ArsR family regulator